MTTSGDDDRLLAAVAGARRHFGDGILAEPGRLALLLNDAAPDLRARVPALVAALAMGAPERLRGAADPGLAGRLAAAVAAEAGVDGARAAAGLDLALRVGGAGPGATPGAPASPAAAPDADWIGVSQAAPVAGGGAMAVRASPRGALPPFLRNRWLLGGLAALTVVVALRASGIVEIRDAPVPAGRPVAGPLTPGPPAAGPPGPRPVEGRPAGPASAVPMLTDDMDRLPTVVAKATPSGPELDFAVPIPGGSLTATVLFPGGRGWDQAQVAFARPGSAPGSVSTVAPFQLLKDGADAVRWQVPRWTRDAVDAGPVCVTFRQRKAPDVQLHGSLLCLMDDSDGRCGQPIGCGIVG